MKIIHLINPLWNAAGGAEWRTLALYDFLKPHADVHIWKQSKWNARFPTQYPIETIALHDKRFPCGGTFVFIGCYWEPGDWVCHTKADRVIIIYNNARPQNAVALMLKRLSVLKTICEFVYASKRMQQLTGLPGHVHPSLIDLNRFTPPGNICAHREDHFCVGRLSRDDASKHHTGDTSVYKELAKAGIKIRIMGGTCLQDLSCNVNEIELLPTCAVPADLFLKELDCFYYRTSPDIYESFGRVIMEAMATGLPVVAHKDGGYAEWITNGKDGFLFESEQEALNLLLSLKQDRSLCKSIGLAARETVEKIYSIDEQNKMLNFYLK